MAPWKIEGTDGSEATLTSGQVTINVGQEKHPLTLQALVTEGDTLYLSVLAKQQSVFFESIDRGTKKSRIFNTVEAIATGISAITWVSNKKRK